MPRQFPPSCASAVPAETLGSALRPCGEFIATRQPSSAHQYDHPQREEAVTELQIVGAAILVGAIVQGLSGLGFSLVASPATSQVLPTAPAIGLVNLLCLVQNIWLVWRLSGGINWLIIKRIGPGLVIGVFVALLPLRLLDPSLLPLLIAVSALGSLGVGVWWKPPKAASDTGLSTGVFGGAVNTYAGVGEEPVLAYMKRQKWSRADYDRTMQIMLGVLNLVSIPMLGLPVMEPWQLLVAVVLIPVGILMGMGGRRLISGSHALQIARVVCLIVAVAAVVRSVILLEQS